MIITWFDEPYRVTVDGFEALMHGISADGQTAFIVETDGTLGECPRANIKMDWRYDDRAGKWVSPTVQMNTLDED